MNIEHFIWEPKEQGRGRWRVVKRGAGETHVAVELVPGAPENEDRDGHYYDLGTRYRGRPEDLVPISDEFTETECVLAGCRPDVAAFYGKRMAA
jgi:hypothetical protein